MQRHLRTIHFLSLTAPLVLSGVAIFLLGWPIRFPYPAAHIVIFFWLIVTGLLGFKWRCTRLSASSITVFNRAFVGFALGAVILGIVFLTPRVVEECGVIYYHYPVPAIDSWVEKLAERFGATAC